MRRKGDRLRGVFFDLYGTLLVYDDLVAAWSEWLEVLYECLREGGLTMPAEAFALRCDGFFGRPEPPPEGRGLTVYERRIEAFGMELGLGLGVEEIREAANATIAAWGKYVYLDPNARSVLEALGSSKTLALVTNFDPPPHVRALLSEKGLIELFETVVISGEVGVKKPDPRIFAPALERTGLQPHEVAFIGDAAEDVEGARAAGVWPIRIRRGGVDKSQVANDFRLDGQTPEDAVDDVQTISSLRELFAIVDAGGRLDV